MSWQNRFKATVLDGPIFKWMLLFIFLFLAIQKLGMDKSVGGIRKLEEKPPSQRLNHGQEPRVAKRDEGLRMESLDERMADLSWFLPPKIQDCNNLGKSQNGDQLQYPEQYLAMRQAHQDKFLSEQHTMYGGKKINVGHIGKLQVQTLLFSTLVNRTSFIKNVCEVGFNGGHSALMWLTSNKNVHLYSFDWGRFDFTRPMAAYIKEKFPDRFDITWGDSKESIPTFTKRHPHFKCDLIWIDGGHNYPEIKADLRNLRAHANEQRHYLLIDDLPIRDDVLGTTKAWQEELEASQVEEYFKCVFPEEKTRGFTLGRYINLP